MFTGLLITFIELIKNRNYNFWSHEFVQCAPEIQKLFESVARSCMVHSPPRMDNHGQPVPAAPGAGSNPQLGLTNEQQAQQQRVRVHSAGYAPGYVVAKVQDGDIDLTKLAENSNYHTTGATLHPKLEVLEYPRNDIIYIRDIGQGAFGRVFQVREQTKLS